MNMHVRGLTETERRARDKHLAFHASIAEKAFALNERREVAQMPEAVAVQAETPAEQKRQLPQMKRLWFAITDGQPPRILISDVIDVCASHYDVSIGDILSQRREAKIVMVRQVGYYLSKALTRQSFPEIGRRFGGRDHTSALHGARKIERLRRTDPKLDKDVRAIAAAVGGSLD